MIEPVRVVVWLVEGTWQGCLDAAVQFVPSDAGIALLHVTPSDVGEVAEAATAGLLGRAFRAHRPIRRFEEVADQEALEILQAAATRLGRENAELVHLRGRVEREVVEAVADGVDLLVVARDGDRSRLGPHSLGHATRFIVDHAPCPVLLVWPDEAPGIESMPPPPPGHHSPPPPPGHHPPPPPPPGHHPPPHGPHREDP
jgi:nucleotide-binding universal stress UspA family protein